MKTIHHILFAILLAAMFTACSNDQEAFEEGRGSQSVDKPVEIRFGIMQTRTSTDAAYKSVFTEGDAIGVFVTRHGTALATSGNYADNLCFTYSGGKWSCPESSELYFPSDGGSLDFFAYYPYRDQIDPTAFAFTVAEDQSATDFYATNDLLMGKTENIRNEVVSISFAHMLTLVNVKVLRGNGIAAFDDTFTVTLHNCVGASTASLATQSATVDQAKKGEIVMSRVESSGTASYNYRALVPAQQIAEGTFLFSFMQQTPGSEVRFNYTTKAASQTEAGGVSKWEISLGKAAPTYQVGDYFPSAEAPEGVVFETDADGTHGKVVYLWEVAGRPEDSYKCVRWGVADFLESANGVPDMGSLTDGETATRQLITVRHAAPNFPSDYSAFKYIFETCNGSKLDGAWYMPAVEELKSFFAAMHGLVYADISAEWVDGTTLPGRPDGVDNNPAAAQPFCTKITSAGGDIPNFYGWYCTSTEAGKDSIRAVHFDEAKVSSQDKFNEWAHVRPIRKF